MDPDPEGRRCAPTAFAPHPMNFAYPAPVRRPALT